MSGKFKKVPRSGGRKLSNGKLVPEPKNVGQSTERKELIGALKKSSVTNLSMTPEAFKNVNQVLPKSTHSALSATP